MKKSDVKIGGIYTAKVSGQLAQVRIVAESPYGGWEATNVITHRKVRIKSAQRLRREVKAAARPPVEQAEVAEPELDPDRCATTRCRGTPVMTYLERPMCQKCWERHCSEEQPSEVIETAGDACRPAEEQETPEQENVMSKKKSNKKQSKAHPVATKAKRDKKVATLKVKATAEQKPKRVSALDAAATVLKKAGKPMHAQELIAAMADQNLWKSPGGKTPHATLYAAMMREARDKGRDARFRKVDRGQFEFVG